jgi:hypothetical protein
VRPEDRHVATCSNCAHYYRRLKCAQTYDGADEYLTQPVLGHIWHTQCELTSKARISHRAKVVNKLIDPSEQLYVLFHSQLRYYAVIHIACD